MQGVTAVNFVRPVPGSMVPAESMLGNRLSMEDMAAAARQRHGSILNCFLHEQALAVACTRLSLLQLPATLSVKCIPVQPGAGKPVSAHAEHAANSCQWHAVACMSARSPRFRQPTFACTR